MLVLPIDVAETVFVHNRFNPATTPKTAQVMIGKVPVIVAYGATEDIRDMMIQSRLGCQSPLATGQYFFLQVLNIMLDALSIFVFNKR